MSSLSTPLHALPSYRSLRRSPRCAGASAAGRTSAPSCSAWRTGASRRELPRALPLPRLHLGHTSAVSRLQELLRTLAALEKTEGDLNDDSLMKEMSEALSLRKLIDWEEVNQKHKETKRDKASAVA